MWILHALSGLFPVVVGAIGEGRVSFKRLRTGEIFDEASLIAIEEKSGRRFVRAVGDSAGGLAGVSGISVCDPFESVEPLFAELDIAEALIKHVLREIFNARAFMSPKVVLQINGRQSPLSDDEKVMLDRFSRSCAIARLYVFLDGQRKVAENEMNHKKLKTLAHFVTRFVS